MAGLTMTSHEHLTLERPKTVTSASKPGVTKLFELQTYCMSPELCQGQPVCHTLLKNTNQLAFSHS